jgi:hypothetical protein
VLVRADQLVAAVQGGVPVTTDELREERLRLVLTRHREQRDPGAALTIGCSCGWCPLTLQLGGSLLQQYLAHVVEHMRPILEEGAGNQAAVEREWERGAAAMCAAIVVALEEDAERHRWHPSARRGMQAAARVAARTTVEPW